METGLANLIPGKTEGRQICDPQFEKADLPASGCLAYFTTNRFTMTFLLPSCWRKEATLNVAPSNFCDHLFKPPEEGRAHAAQKITLEESSVTQATKLHTTAGSVPTQLAWGHGEGAIKISSRVSGRILKAARCPKGGLKAGGFALRLVAANYTMAA